MKQLKNFSRTEAHDETDNEVLDEVMGKYKGMDEDALTEELLAAVKKAKEDGSFNPGEIESFYALVAPQLDPEQREKLSSLIKVISLDE